MKANKKKNQIQKLVSIRKIAERLNLVIINILFIRACHLVNCLHMLVILPTIYTCLSYCQLFTLAWSGCNSTSAIFNKGKTALMKLIVKGNRPALDICPIFSN